MSAKYGNPSIPATGINYMPSRFDSSPDGLALIANGGLKQLVADLRLTYDWIILRGPPVIGVKRDEAHRVGGRRHDPCCQIGEVHVS